MSLSKLESLPNEILSDIIEKYINGVDVLTAFSYQLNHRFNAIITQCHRLRFNFIQCRKDDFCFCMGLLPAYIDKIEELAILEQDTPGQVHAFLSFFPSFTPFKRLRKLYFHLNADTLDWKMGQRALRSLSNTIIDTLSIKIEKPENTLTSNDMTNLLCLKTLKRVCLVSDLDYFNWDYLGSVSSNIEYLTVTSRYCEFKYLQFIFQWAPRLKYLDVGTIDGGYSISNESEQRSGKNIIPMSALRTLVLAFGEHASCTLDMLASYFNAMPVLNHLEIKANSRLGDADAWKWLLETSLPLLTHFTLRPTTSHVRDVNTLRASFQNSFWITKRILI